MIILTDDQGERHVRAVSVDELPAWVGNGWALVSLNQWCKGEKPLALVEWVGEGRPVEVAK